MKNGLKRGLPLLLALLFATTSWAGDTCIFTVTADSVPPNVMVLLDNGAEMEHINWHGNFDDRVTHAPGTCADMNRFAIYDRTAIMAAFPTESTTARVTVTQGGAPRLTVTLAGLPSLSATSSAFLPPEGTYPSANLTVVNVAAGTVQIAIDAHPAFLATIEKPLANGADAAPFIRKDPTGQALGPYLLGPTLSYAGNGDGRDAYCNGNGYSIFTQGQNVYLRRIKDDLDLDSQNVATFYAITGTDRFTIPALHLLWFDQYTIGGVVQPGYGSLWEGSAWSTGNTVTGATSNATGVVEAIIAPVDTQTWTTSSAPDADGIVTTSEHSYRRFGVIVRQTSVGGFVAGYNEKIFSSTNGGVPNTSHSKTLRRAVTLPRITPWTTVDPVTGIKDANNSSELIRLSANYLNWLSFAHRYDSEGAPLHGTNYTGPGGADLPDKRRFYYAKMAIRDAAAAIGRQAAFGLRNFAGADGSSSVQPLSFVTDTNNVVNSAFLNNINNMGTGRFSPLAEGLADIGRVFAGNSVSGYVSEHYCQKHFAIVVTAGYSSEDTSPGNQAVPGVFLDYDGDGLLLDGDGTPIGEGKLLVDGQVHDIPVRLGGSTYLDDVAHYLHTHDVIPYRAGFQNLWTYTVGTGTSQGTRRFLINTSNNGNGNFNLTDSTNPEYGRYHFDARDPQDLSAALIAALNSILSRTATFTAPVVPVTRTTSGDLIYLAFFKPLSDSNFWEGNITKFGLGAGNEIQDRNGNPATWPNGAMRDDATAYWETKLWGDPSATNFMPNATRKIYTFTGSNLDLTHSSNAFVPSNSIITKTILGTPRKTNSNFATLEAREAEARVLLMNYIRGADSFDQNGNGNISENRRIIHGDALHGEPIIVPYGNPNDQRRMVYFSANDGMLHAVRDEDGKEAWGFIPPDQLHRLRELTEGLQHPFFIDSSPKVFLDDINGDGYIDHTQGERAILICGYRKGGKGYFALDISNPDSPKLLWRMTDRDPSIAGMIHLTESATSWANVVNGYFLASGFHSDGTWYNVSGSTANEALTSGKSMPYQLGVNLRPGTNIELQIVRHYSNGTCSVNNGPAVATCNYDTPPVLATIDRIEEFGFATDSTNSLRVVQGLGQSWSEPVYAKVKTANDLYSDTTNCSALASPGSLKFKECLAANPGKWKQVAIFGGGYNPNWDWWSGLGSFVQFVDIYTGQTVRQAWTGYGSIPSAVTVIDADNNGFIDKVYVGDMGGNLWRIGQFDEYYNQLTGEQVLDDDGNPAVPPFPKTNENIHTWQAERLFSAGCDEMGGSCTNYVDDDGDLLVDETRRFFYPPDVALENGFDLLLIGSGDREAACNTKTRNRLYVVKDDHQLVDLAEGHLINTTAGGTPNLYGGDTGFYLVLPDGDKALAEGVLFYKVFYITVFSPSTTDPCTPGGVTYLYSFGYRSGAGAADMDGDGVKDLSTLVGGGIGSKPVVILRDGEKTGMLISVGSTNPDDTPGSTTGAGVRLVDPDEPDFNFNMLWWQEMF